MLNKLFILFVFIVLSVTSFSWAHSNQRYRQYHGHYHNGSLCHHPINTCPFILANPGIQINFHFSIYGQFQYISCRNQYNLCLNQTIFTWDPYHARYLCQADLNHCLGYYY